MKGGFGTGSRNGAAVVLAIVHFTLLDCGNLAEAFPGLPCFNNSQCDSPSRCVGGFCCLYQMGFSCQACANVTGECLLNDCDNCAPGEQCLFKRDADHGCCKSSVNARECLTYCNLTGDCNELFANGDLCEINQQCQSELCLGELNFDKSYCCNADVGFTCTACEKGTGNCIAVNFLVYVMGAMAVLLCLTGVSCLVTGRNGYLPGTGGLGIDDYGGNAVRVLSPFDNEEDRGGAGGDAGPGASSGRTGEGQGGENEVIEAVVFGEGEDEDGETLSAEIIPAPTGRPSL